MSGIFLLRVMRISSRRYLSYCSLMYLMMGSQLRMRNWGMTSQLKPHLNHHPPGRDVAPRCVLPVLIVDLVPKPRRVCHRQLHLHTLLLNDYGAEMWLSGNKALRRSRGRGWGSEAADVSSAPCPSPLLLPRAGGTQHHGADLTMGDGL